MENTSARRIRAGLSFLFASGERPDAAGLEAALAACQTSARMVRRTAGTAEIVASGLTFEVDGLAPGPALRSKPGHEVQAAPDQADHDAVMIFPGHHLSGGASLAPVTRALLALAAELAVSLPVHVIHWHSADTVIEPPVFSRSTLAWLAGGAFPARNLTALTTLADGSVASRGLAHFVGQEVTVRGRPEDAEQTMRLAGQVVDRLVRTGPLEAFAEWTVQDRVLCVEPSRHAGQVLVWQAP